MTTQSPRASLTAGFTAIGGLLVPGVGALIVWGFRCLLPASRWYRAGIAAIAALAAMGVVFTAPAAAVGAFAGWNLITAFLPWSVPRIPVTGWGVLAAAAVLVLCAALTEPRRVRTGGRSVGRYNRRLLEAIGAYRGVQRRVGVELPNSVMLELGPAGVRDICSPAGQREPLTDAGHRLQPAVLDSWCHELVIGRTRSGKTVRLMLDARAAAAAGIGVVFIDLKGGRDESSVAAQLHAIAGHYRRPFFHIGPAATTGIYEGPDERGYAGFDPFALRHGIDPDERLEMLKRWLPKPVEGSSYWTGLMGLLSTVVEAEAALAHAHGDVPHTDVVPDAALPRLARLGTQPRLIAPWWEACLRHVDITKVEQYLAARGQSVASLRERFTSSEVDKKLAAGGGESMTAMMRQFELAFGYQSTLTDPDHHLTIDRLVAGGGIAVFDLPCGAETINDVKQTGSMARLALHAVEAWIRRNPTAAQTSGGTNLLVIVDEYSLMVDRSVGWMMKVGASAGVAVTVAQQAWHTQISDSEVREISQDVTTNAHRWTMFTGEDNGGVAPFVKKGGACEAQVRVDATDANGAAVDAWTTRPMSWIPEESLTSTPMPLEAWVWESGAAHPRLIRHQWVNIPGTPPVSVDYAPLQETPTVTAAPVVLSDDEAVDSAAAQTPLPVNAPVILLDDDDEAAGAVPPLHGFTPGRHHR